jgi:hypothetical protein
MQAREDYEAEVQRRIEENKSSENENPPSMTKNN